MPAVKVLLEVFSEQSDPFARHSAALASAAEAEVQADDLLSSLDGLGIELDEDMVPIPMFSTAGGRPAIELEAFSMGPVTAAVAPSSSQSVVVPAEVSRSRLDALREAPNVKVWPNSEMVFFAAGDSVFDAANSRGGLDCRPFRSAVEIETIRTLLGVDSLWADGYRGQNTVVGIIDEGVNGDTYPVIGGFSRPTSGLQPGSAPVTSHGSMCAADILIAAPATRIYDYPFLGVPNSGGALQMFQAVLNQRLIDGTPHITNNSYGFVGVPPLAAFPDHEVHNIDHPVHRKVREVVAAGVTCFFAAGNCGENCPSGSCHTSGIGPGNSIHASNSLEEVITVAAVNSMHERIGYSSQGPGMFFQQKPDVASYSHFFANFGPGRPGGLDQPFDNGTSAATPVAAGVGAALISSKGTIAPALLKQILMESAYDLGHSIGWDDDHGSGVINAAAAYSRLRLQPAP